MVQDAIATSTPGLPMHQQKFVGDGMLHWKEIWPESCLAVVRLPVKGGTRSPSPLPYC